MQRNLTLTLDDDLLRLARKVAIDRNTSVNQLVREYLEQLAREADERKAAIEDLRDFFQNSRTEIGPITWRREDLYERR